MINAECDEVQCTGGQCCMAMRPRAMLPMGNAVEFEEISTQLDSKQSDSSNSSKRNVLDAAKGDSAWRSVLPGAIQFAGVR